MFCLYHAYTTKPEQKWYWIIIFFPFIGSLFYLYHTFYSQRNIDNLTEEVKNVFVSNYKIDKLEKQLSYSDTVANRILLADEHHLAGNYSRALELYQSCLQGLHEDDPKLLLKILENSYLNREYETAIEYGVLLKGDKLFEDSTERISLAWSYYEMGKEQDAEHHFRAMDKRFSNYEHRLEYARFLALTSDNTEASKGILKELLDEIDAMDAYEKRLKKSISQKIKYEYQQMA